MKRTFWIGCYLVVLMIGVVAGRLWGTLADYHLLFDQVAQRDSAELESRVTALSQLRLGRVDDAIRFLEVPLDNCALQIAFAENQEFQLNPNRMKANRLRALQLAKVYRTIYPSDETTDPPLTRIFAQIPDMKVRSDHECDGAFATLLNEYNSKTADKVKVGQQVNFLPTELVFRRF